MKDFHYHQHAVDLDRRLEQVINTELEAQKSATSTPDEAPLGLQSFIERHTIAEEIAATRAKSAHVEATTDLNIIRAREKIAGIAEERAGRFDAFTAAIAPMVEEVTKSAAEQVEIDNRIAALRGSVTERS